jgi:aminoglycoside phosphotransferase (APT) family kinase protein
VFLFPRSADGVEWFERELAAYRALAEGGSAWCRGDLHEDQLLADGGQLTGVIDWETARVGQREEDPGTPSTRGRR